MKNRIISVLVILCLACTLVSCSAKGPDIKISLGDAQVGLTGGFADSTKAIHAAGYTPYDYTARKQVADDGLTLEKVEKLELGSVTYARKTQYNPLKLDAKDCVGYYEYGFEQYSTGDFTLSMDDKTIETYDEALNNGFYETRMYAVKLITDGKEVNIADYEDLAKRFMENLYVTKECTGAQFMVQEGLIAEESEYNTFQSGYGIVREIGWENLTATLNMLSMEETNVGIDNNFIENNPAAVKLCAVVLAASDAGMKYHKGKLKSCIAVLVPADPTEIYFVNVACEGTEVEEWNKK